jgi:muramoyltetrapeptide carboxypeptidase
LYTGATIGVVAPAGPVQRKSVDTGIAFLREAGFNIVAGKYLYRREGYLAGSDEMRAEDLNRMLADPDVDAVFCARGGYGSGRILHYIEPELLTGNPKIIMGFSDITVLLLHVLRQANTVTYHGPVVSKLHRDTPPETVKCMLGVLKQEFPLNLMNMLSEGTTVNVFRHGTGSGPLMGGCLSLLQTLAGTELAMDMRGKILFWEEVGEKLYRIDRMLNHLSRAGCFEGLNGVIVGKLVACMFRLKGEQKRFLDLLETYFGGHSYPVIYDVPIGHTKLQLTLPEGGYCHMDTAAQRLILDRSPS